MRRLMLLSAILATGLVPASGASAATPKPGAWKLTGSDGHGHTVQAAFVITRRGGEAHKFPVTHPSCRQYYLVGIGEDELAESAEDLALDDDLREAEHPRPFDELRSSGRVLT